MTAGFYYKTFMWPRSFWEKFYEPLIRRAAGLGRAAGEADPDHYEKAIAFCDVLVIGGGPGGARGGAGCRSRRRARDPLRERFCARRPAACRAHARSTGRPAVDWLAGCRGRAGKPARGPRDAADDGVRRLRSRHLWRARTGERSSAGAAGSSPASARLAHRGQARRACRGGDRAADRVRRQRPAGRHARRARCGPISIGLASLRQSGPSVFTACDDGWLTARDLAGAGVPVTDRRCAARGRPGAGGAPWHAGHSGRPGHAGPWRARRSARSRSPTAPAAWSA